MTRNHTLRHTAAMMGLSGAPLDADARAIVAHRVATRDPRAPDVAPITAAEWTDVDEVAAQAHAAVEVDRGRRQLAEASGWRMWPPRPPGAPRWPTMNPEKE